MFIISHPYYLHYLFKNVFVKYILKAKCFKEYNDEQVRKDLTYIRVSVNSNFLSGEILVVWDNSFIPQISLFSPVIVQMNFFFFGLSNVL